MKEFLIAYVSVTNDNVLMDTVFAGNQPGAISMFCATHKNNVKIIAITEIEKEA